MTLTQPASAQVIAPADAGTISGVVVDPQGAVIPQAAITITRSGAKPVLLQADERGNFSSKGLKPGLYTVEAAYSGFRTMRKDAVAVKAGATQRLTLTLTIETDQQQVTVSSDDDTADSGPERSGGTITLKGKALDMLSDDPATMQQQLLAMAGLDPNQTKADIYVDGFSGGKIPPKSSILAIILNQSPYSAKYGEFGEGRIEFFTKPGTEKLEGEFDMQGDDSALNSRDPFATEQPDYYHWYYGGDLTGPINKKMAYYAGAYGMHGQNDSIVNAIILDSNLNQTPFQQAVSSPTNSINIAPRFDFQIGKSQTVSLRYQFTHMTNTNAGIGQLALATQAYNTDNTEQSLQFSDTQAYGAKVVNETRFQYVRDRNNQVALNGAPTVNVSGAFIGGGSSQGIVRDNQDHYEFQDYAQLTLKKHVLLFGGRLRGMRDSNYSTSGYNGQYTFESLDAYQITMQNLGKLTPAQIRAAGGGASQYTQTTGNPSVAVTLIDLGLYLEDNWTIKPGTTLSYGLRYEGQTDIHDHADWAPRLYIGHSFGGGKDKAGHPLQPFLSIRGGAGLFYQRFDSTGVLQAKRQNGVTQSAVVVNSPDFYPADCVTTPTACSGGENAAGTPTIYSIDPKLHAPYTLIASFRADKPFGKHLQTSWGYYFREGQHQLETRNINAPLPGTYNPDDPSSGTRPLGLNENIYQYGSEGFSTMHELSASGGFQSKKGGIFGGYRWGRHNADTGGGFPSNQYDLHVDYGRTGTDARSQGFLDGFTQLPGKIQLFAFADLQSAPPFNITVGQDLNGDTLFNDRPAFATDLTRASVYRTPWGNFDADPLPGQQIIPINYGTAHPYYLTFARLGRGFRFGPRLPDEPAPAGDKAPKADAAKPAKPVKKEIPRKYNLELGINASNVFNHVNLGPPIGVLGSPLFGISNTINGMNGSANRTVNLDMRLYF